ncbi:hypothetical protein GQ600_23982 [Phytophthora cactorum]|nr:hypothetical protein GQ600_23982 [Phytophthora cactorum]
MDRWHASYQHLLEQVDDLEQLCPQPQNGISPTRNGPASFRASFMAWGLVEMTSSLHGDTRRLEGLVDATYLDNIRHGEADPGELELYVSSKLHNWNIEVKTVNADCSVDQNLRIQYSHEKERPITLHTRCELHVGGLELQPAA